MNKLKKKNHKGATPAVIGTFIIIIASALVLFLFLSNLNTKGTTDYEVCHNAVLTRAAAVLPKEAVPLNCKTSYICISRDGTCEAMTNPEIIKVNTADDVYSVLANHMAICWQMFGEGKLDYIGSGSQSKLYCSICSQVAFDDSTDSLFAINPSPIARASAGIPETDSNFLINKQNFYDYLSKNNASGKDVSYLNYFLGLQSPKTISNILQTQNSSYGYIDLQKQYLLVMGEFNRVGTFQSILTGIQKGAELFLVLPLPLVGGPMAVNIIVSSFTDQRIKGGLIGTIITGESGQNYLSPIYVEANSEDYNKLNCADIKTLA